MLYALVLLFDFVIMLWGSSEGFNELFSANLPLPLAYCSLQHNNITTLTYLTPNLHYTATLWASMGIMGNITLSMPM